MTSSSEASPQTMKASTCGCVILLVYLIVCSTMALG